LGIKFLIKLALYNYSEETVLKPKDAGKDSSITLGNNAPVKQAHGLMGPINLAELMTRDIVSVTPENTLYEAAQLMGDKRIGSLLVLKYDTPVGVITERDLLNVVSRGVKLEKDWIGGGTSIREEKVATVMSSPVVKICQNSSLKKAARIMIEKRIRRIIVCDSGTIAGIITASDMIRSLPEAPENMKVWFQVDYFMAKQIETVNEELLVEKVAEVMAEKRVGSVIVTSQGKPKGIFTERDLLTKFLASDKSLIAEVGTACSSPLITAPVGMCIHEAAEIMTKNRIKRLPITKEKELIGVLSARDLVEAYARPAT
jgi:CBS domain-containing protein